ncbi:uncharacterized protein METZ01_LOCUS487445, partial [marine metagenome]
MGEPNPQPPSKDWLVTGVIVIALMGGAWFWRSQQTPTVQSPPRSLQPATAIDDKPLPRTRKLVRQKIGSLEAYNQKIPQANQLQEFFYWTDDREVDP